MPFFRISKANGNQVLGGVEADDERGALDAFAMKQGFWDFDELAASMDVPVEKAAAALRVIAVPVPAPDAMPTPVPEFEVA